MIRRTILKALLRTLFTETAVGNSSDENAVQTVSCKGHRNLVVMFGARERINFV